MNDQSLDTNSIRRVLRTAGVINLLLAVFLFLGMGIALGWARLVIMDRYSELYNRGVGVISVDRLREFHNGAYSDDEFAPLFKFLLAGKYDGLPGEVLNLASVLLAANGAFLIWRFFKVPKLPAGKRVHEQESGMNGR
jgi:hypothetical protein